MRNKKTLRGSGCILALIALSFLPSGCQPLAPGTINDVRSISRTPRLGNVYLVRGWRDLYSAGIDQLGDELRENGVSAEVYRESQWIELSDALAERYSSAGPHEPLVFIGFSYGADDVLRIAERLSKHAIAAHLVITIDPVTPPPVPGNVRACYNYFQTNGVWDLFPWLRGIPLHASERTLLVNIDIRRDRPDWVGTDLSHATIAANRKLHQAIIERVLAVCPLRNSVK